MNNHLKKYFSFRFWGFHLLVVFGAFFFLRFESANIYPYENSSDILLNTFHEDDTVKHSLVDVQNKSQSLLFKYTLHKEIKEPFAGIYFHQAQKDSFFDFSSFNQIKIYIKTKKVKEFRFI